MPRSQSEREIAELLRARAARKEGRPPPVPLAPPRRPGARPVPLARPGVSVAPPTFTPRFELTPQPALRPEGLPLLTPERASRDDNLQQFVRDELLDIGARHRAVVDRARARQQATESQRQAPEEQDGGGILAPVERGLRQSAAGFTATAAAVGGLPPEMAAAIIAQQQQRLLEIPRSAEVDRFFASEGGLEMIGNFFDAPGDILGTLAAEVAGAAAPQVLLAGGVSAASGPAAVVTGPVAVAGTSLALSAGDTILAAFADAGVDLTDQAALAEAFRNEALVADALERGALKGAPVAVLDGLSAGLAGKIAKPLSRLVSGPVKQQLLQQAGETAIDVTTGITGTVFGNKLVGEETTGPELFVEGLGSVIARPIDRSTIDASAGRRQRQASTEARAPDPRASDGQQLTLEGFPRDAEQMSLSLETQNPGRAPVSSDVQRTLIELRRQAKFGRPASGEPPATLSVFPREARQLTLEGFPRSPEQRSFSLGREPGSDPAPIAQLNPSMRMALRQQGAPVKLNPAMIERFNRAMRQGLPGQLAFSPEVRAALLREGPGPTLFLPRQPRKPTQ